MGPLHEGDLVQSKVRLVDADDNDADVAQSGDLGRVESVDNGPPFPTACVVWERTGRLYDVLLDEVEVLAEPGFATTPATTPRKARTVYIRRGVQ